MSISSPVLSTRSPLPKRRKFVANQTSRSKALLLPSLKSVLLRWFAIGRTLPASLGRTLSMTKAGGRGSRVRLRVPMLLLPTLSLLLRRRFAAEIPFGSPLSVRWIGLLPCPRNSFLSVASSSAFRRARKSMATSSKFGHLTMFKNSKHSGTSILIRPL